MISPSSTYQSKIYRSFKEIESNDFRTVIRFYEERAISISNLEFEEYFELLFCYTNATFEVGAYNKYIRLAKQVIEQSIDKNIQFFQGKDILCHCLFRKAAAHYNLNQLPQAAHLLQELIKIDPSHEDAIKLLKRIYYKSNIKILKFLKAAAIFSFLISTVIIVLEVLVVQNFFPLHQVTFQTIHLTFLVLGVLIYLLGELYLRWKANENVRNFTASAKQKKAF
jgi:tetratricopeptide (TPR) repeat protein